jgi:hypothetical protein
MTLDEVADHRLDPYGAADRLLADLSAHGRNSGTADPDRASGS